jgi:hypothetical protein
MESQPQHPTLFSGDSSFTREVTRHIVRSEIEGGVYLAEIEEGEALEVRTENRSYRIELRDGRAAYISGHPVFCPEPTRVAIHGSSWGGSMLKLAFIGRGMHLEFQHPEYRTITTSRILDIRQAAAA